MLSTNSVDLLFVLTAVNRLPGGCRQEFKLLLLINKLTGVPVRAAVVTAHHLWQLWGTFLLQSIYSCDTLLCSVTVLKCKDLFCFQCEIGFTLKKKNALIGSYYVTRCISQSLFLVKLFQKNVNSCQSQPSASSIVYCMFYCVMFHLNTNVTWSVTIKH